MDINSIHQKALSLAKNFKRLQAELIAVLQLIDSKKVFRKLGYSSTYDYCLKALGLSENDAYSFIRVARASTEIPELKEAVQKGKINLSAAKRVSSVIKPENKDQWLHKAEVLPQKALELEIVKENPKEMIQDRIKPINSDFSGLHCGIRSKVEKLVKRVQNLESQRQKRPCTYDETIEAMALAYLEKNDPVRKAERAIDRADRKEASKNIAPTKLALSPQIPTKVVHEVHKRDNGQCVFVDKSGSRCESSRHLAIHHIRPTAMGGGHELDNLATLCFSHHAAIHDGLTGFRLATRRDRGMRSFIADRLALPNDRLTSRYYPLFYLEPGRRVRKTEMT